MTQRTIKYGIAFDVDKVSLDRIQNQLQKIMNTPSSGMEKGFEKTKQTASEVYQILRQCYNQDLGSLNVEKFNAKLKQSGIGLKELQSLGPSTFNRMGMAMASANVQLNRSNAFINNIVKTMTDSAKWSMAYGLINKVSQSITDAISYVKDLDTSLNDIRIVTSKSEADMRSFAQEANKTAIALGSSTKAYTDASLIYYQQGLGDAEAKERARITTMVANVTGQSAASTSEQLTAIWNGYKVNAAEAELYIDKVAKVAAQTGADLEELSTGMSKVASAANIMGVDIDELNAQLATVITVTRQAPESVGTAFKTIYARINAIESGSEDAEVTLKNYTKTMFQYGVNVLDMNGKLRDTGDVIAEIGGKWGTMTKEQQLGLAQAMAGQRQYNNLLALFDNWDMYNDALHESQTAMGTLQKQQDIYMDSIEAHAAQAKAQFESLYENILDKQSINAFYDFTGNIAGTFDKMFSSFGGGLTSLIPVLLSIGSLFSKQVATGAYNLFSTLSKISPVIENIRRQMALISAGAQGTTSASVEVRALATGYQAQLDILERMQAVRAGLNEDQQKEIIDGATRLGQLEEELALADSVMQRRAQDWGEVGGIENINSIISNEDITASYHSRQMGKSPEDDALGRMIKEQEVLIQEKEKAIAIEKKHGSAIKRATTIVHEKNGAIKAMTENEKASLSAAAEKLGIDQKQYANERELAAAIQKKLNAMRNVTTISKEELDTLQEISAEMTETAGQFSRQRIEAEGLKDALDNNLNSASKLSSVVKGTTTILSGVGTLAMSWQMISTSIDAFKEASEGAISWGDAITQAFMSIGMGLPMVLGAIKSINETFGITTGIIDGYNAKKQISNQLDQASIPLIGKKITDEHVWRALKFKSLTIEQSSLNTQQKKALADALENKNHTVALGILKGLNKEQLASLGLDEAKIANLEKMTIAQGKYNASAWANPYLLIGAAIVATIAAIIAVTYKAVTAESTHEKKVKELKQSLEDQKSAHDELAQSIEKTQAAFDKYKSIKATLDSCTKGTQAWNEAFLKTNEAAIELINSSKELASMEDLWELKDGRYVINETVVQEGLDKANSQLSLSSHSMQNTELAIAEAQLDKRKDELRRSVFDEEISWEQLLEDKNYWGVALKVLSGGDDPYSSSEYKRSKAFEEALFNEDFQKGIIKTDDKIKKLAETFGLTEKETKKVIDTYKELTQEQKEYNAQERNKRIAQVQGVYGADASAEEIAFGTNVYDLAYDNAIANLEKEGFISGAGINRASGKNNSEYQEMLRQLSAATGQTYAAAIDTTNVVQGNDSNRKFVVNLNGEDIVLSKETVKQTIATGKALQALGKDAASASEALRFIQSARSSQDEATQAAGAALYSLLVNKDFTGLTAKQLEEFKNARGEDEIFNEEELNKISITADMAEDLGYTSFTDLINDINSILDNYDIDSYKEKLLNPELKNLFTDTEISGEGWNELTGKEREGFASQINDIFKAIGTDAATVFSDLLTQGSAGFEDGLVNFDYANASFEDFIELYRQNGVTIDETTQGAEKLFNYLKNNATAILNQTTADFLTLANSAKSLKLGETISAEDYEKYGSIAEDYFTKMADGTYILTQDADLFYNSILNKSDEFRQERKDQIQKEINEENALLDALGNWAKKGSGVYTKGVAKEKYGGADFEEQRYTLADELTLLLTLVGDKMSADDKAVLESAIAKGYAGEAIGDSGGAISALVTKYMAVAETLGVVEERQKSQQERLKDEDKAALQAAKTWEDFEKIVKKSNLTEEEIAEQREARQAKEIADLEYSTKAFDAYVDSIIEANGEVFKSHEEAERFALANLHLKEGIEELHDSWEKWEEILNQGASNPEYFDVIESLKTSLGEIFQINPTLIDSEFFTPTVIKDIGLAAEGDLDAIRRLSIAIAKIQSKKVTLEIEGNDEEDIKEIYAFIDKIAAIPIEPGQNISDEAILNFYKYLIEQAGWTVTQIEALFNGMNIGVINLKTATTGGKTKKEVIANVAKYKEQGYTLQGFSQNENGEWIAHMAKNPSFTGLDTPDFHFDSDKNKKDPDWATKEDKIDLARVSQEEYWKSYDKELRTATKELKAMEKELSALAKQGEHLIGQDKIDNLNKQISLIKQQNTALKKQNERLMERAKLEAQYLTMQYAKYGLIVDANTGELQNYSQVYQTLFNTMLEAQKALNAAIDAGIDKNTENFKTLKAAADEAAEALNEFTSVTSAFEEIFSSIEDNNATIAENLDEIIDKQIEAFNAKIEVEIDLTNFKKDWAEFQRLMKWDENNFQDIVDIADDKLKQLDQYYGAGGIIEKLTAHLNDLTNNGEGVYQTHTKEYLEDLKNYASELMSNLEDAEALIDEIKETFIELMDMAQEDFDAQISRYEALNGVLEHNINLLNLLDGEENNYAAKQVFYDKQTENYMAQLAFGKQQIAFWQEQLAFAEKGSEAAKAAEENLIAAIEANQSTLEEAIEAAQTAHINSIHAIFEELEDSITNSKGINQLSNEWELIKENADYYLDDVNKAYELSKLESNYRKAIDESDSVYAQRQINDMMSSELAMLKEKDKLTKYDIDRANLKYQLTLKQIALEDAQKNKSTMRLKRDKNGNYSYQYVADSSATSQLEQEIADLNNQIHNLDKEALRNNLDEILSVWQDYKDALIEIEESGGTEEEKAEKRLAINALYKEKLENLMRENQFMLTSIESATIATITGDWDNGVQQMIDAIQAEGGLESVMTEVMDNITAKTKEYEQTMDDLAQAAGKDLNEIYQGYDKNINILKPLIAGNEDIISLYEVEMNSMRNLLNLLDQMVAGYNAVRDAAMGALQSAVNQYEQVSNNSLASNNTGNNNNPNIDWSREWAKEAVDGSSQYSLDDIISSRFKKLNGTTSSEEDYAEDAKIGTYDNARIQHILDNIGTPAVREWVTAVAEGKAYFTNEWRRHFLEGKVANWTSFNTGGYTGEWTNGDSDGKLAFLHQKELVLNNTDTANILKAVDIVHALDINMMSRVAGMLDQIGLHSMGAYTPVSAPVEQNVHIDAHFPNVSSAQEIQEAFDQLADQLGQILYQNRK